MNNNNIISMLNGLKQNPMQTLLSAKLNVPQEIINNPQAIVQHLLSTGQVSQNQVNQAMQMSNNSMFKGLFNR